MQLVSGSADNSIAVWDVVGASSEASSQIALQPSTGDSSASDLGSKNVPFLISRLYTKETPAIASRFTRTNLIMAAGAFSPKHK